MNNHRLKNNSGLKYLPFISLLICLIVSSPASAEDFYVGDVINLGGSSPSNYVYIFVVGPNLPSGGANPEDIQSAVVTDDPDSFVRVTVNSGRWNYKWDTSTSSGTPDAGVYRVYAASKPVSLSDLSSADYSMTVVNIVKPYVTAGADGGIITAKTGVVPENVNDDAVAEIETESESGIVSVSSAENTSNSVSGGLNYPEAAETGVMETTAVSESASSEKSGLPAGLPLLAIGILFLVFFVLSKKGQK